MDEKRLWEEYDKWFFGKGISDYGTKMFGFMAAKWAMSLAASAPVPCYQCKGCGDNDCAPGLCTRCNGTGFETTAPAVEKECACDAYCRDDGEGKCRYFPALVPAVEDAKCWCETCRPITMTDMRMVVCPDCGNKRCPKATNHVNACTNSNEVGQKGSSWESVKPFASPTVGDSAGEPVAFCTRVEYEQMMRDGRLALIAFHHRTGPYDVALYAHPPVQTADVRAMALEEAEDMLDRMADESKIVAHRSAYAYAATMVRALLEQKK